MPIQTINLGNYANDGTGDDLRTAFEKVNANFADLSGTVAIQTAIVLGNPTNSEGSIFAQKNGSTLEFKKITSVDESVTITHTDTAVNLHANTKLENDTSPKLGGNLNLNNHNVTGTGNIGLIGDPNNNSLTVNGFKIPDLASVLGMLFYTQQITLDFGTVPLPTGWTGTQGQDEYNIDMGYCAGLIGHLGPSALNLDFGSA